MSQKFSMTPIAHIHSDFAEKFGVPRQSGLVEELEADIVFEPAYQNPDALRGLEDFSHIWLIWVFDRAIRDTWSPTVRPPRLGGNTRMGVFATRSPFRPNPIALSCVKLAGIRQTADGPVLRVRGADLVNGTPILDIKPYIPYADSHPDALGGFAAVPAGETLSVSIPPALLAQVPAERQEALRGVLAQDPRHYYQKDPERVYGFSFAGFESVSPWTGTSSPSGISVRLNKISAEAPAVRIAADRCFFGGPFPYARKTKRNCAKVQRAVFYFSCKNPLTK